MNILKKPFILILLAFFISISARMLWVFYIDNSYDIFKWNGQFVPTTIDTYFWGSIIQKALGAHSFNPHLFSSDIYTGMVTFFGFIAVKLLPISLDTFLFYSPVIVASLIVIPLFFIGRMLGSNFIGFCAAICGAIGWSYFNRSTVGYYDTDMFSVTFPVIIGFFMLKSIEAKNLKYSLMAALSVYYYNFFYPAGTSIGYALIICYSFYIFFFYRNEDFSYKSILQLAAAGISLSFLPSFALFNFPFLWVIKSIIIILVFFALENIKIKKGHIRTASILIFIIFLFLANPFQAIFSKIGYYLSRGASKSLAPDTSLKFFSVIGTVQEAHNIDFSRVALRISGGIICFFIGLCGYILTLFKRRDFFFIMLPIIGVGLFSLKGGLRFTIYAVPVFALSAVYLIYFLSNKFIKNKIFSYSIFFAAVFFLLFSNIKHAITYRPIGSFDKPVIEAMDYLKKKAAEKDYVLTWWDYGTGIWYYTGLNTLSSPSDNGRHVNFSVSHILSSSSQNTAANLSRLLVENFAGIAERKEPGPDRYFEYLLKERQKEKFNPDKFLRDLESENFDLPDKTKEIYLYLPHKMMRIINKIALFSNRDLLTGKEKQKMTLSILRKKEEDKNIIVLENGFLINKKNLSVKYPDGRDFNFKNFYSVSYKKNRSIISKKLKSMAANYNIVYYQPIDSFLFMDDKMLNSNFVQLYIFDNYNKELFEPVSLHPAAKIYKLKI